MPCAHVVYTCLSYAGFVWLWLNESWIYITNLSFPTYQRPSFTPLFFLPVILISSILQPTSPTSRNLRFPGLTQLFTPDCCCQDGAGEEGGGCSSEGPEDNIASYLWLHMNDFKVIHVTLKNICNLGIAYLMSLRERKNRPANSDTL